MLSVLYGEKCDEQVQSVNASVSRDKKKVEDNTGEKYTLTTADLEKGVTTIKQKIELDCEFYHRLDALFGNRQNVKPASVLQPVSYIPNPVLQSIVEENITLPVYSDSED